MNILDENIPKNQRELLLNWRITVRHIGVDVGRRGIQDDEILPLLHQLRQPTFFTRDSDFYRRNYCHQRYCLVYMDIERSEVAIFVRRFLHHGEFNTHAKRLGKVVRLSSRGLVCYELNKHEPQLVEWD